MITFHFEDGAPANLRHVTVDAVIPNADGHILLIKRAVGVVESGRWCLPGGFVEQGEDLQTAVRREVLEEIGIGVRGLELFAVASNPSRDVYARGNVSCIFLIHEWLGPPVMGPEASDFGFLGSLDCVDSMRLAADHFKVIEAYFAWRREGASGIGVVML